MLETRRKWFGSSEHSATDWRYRHYGVSEREARRIARAHGLARVWNSFRTRDVWVVSGEDWRRHPIRIVIDEDTGRVVDIDRGRRW